jgi:hypothetical protein
MKTTFVEESCEGNLCDFKNIKEATIVEDKDGNRPIIYMKDYFFSSREVNVSTIIKRRSDAETLLGEILQLSTTG